MAHQLRVAQEWGKITLRKQTDTFCKFSRRLRSERLTGMDWETFCNNTGLIRWAYVDDLLPERKKKAE